MTIGFDFRFSAVLVVAVAGLAAFAVACASLAGSDDGDGAVGTAAVDFSYAATVDAWAFGVTRTARAYDATGTALAHGVTAEARSHEAAGTALAYRATEGGSCVWSDWDGSGL